MPLSNDDWEDVLAHTRERVREVGLADEDIQIMLDFRSEESTMLNFLSYLDSLLNAVGERSSSRYQQTLDVLRQSVSTEKGGEISEIDIQVDERDYGLLGAQRIQLGNQADFSVLIEELKKLREDIRKDVSLQ
jgi:hypothetical protein